MQTIFRKKHFIDLDDWTKEELDTVLDVSYELKRKFALGITTPYLRDQTVFLMFFNESTRTRNSMETGITQLGGHGNYLDASKMQIQHGDNAKDTATILSRYGHAIACRHCSWGVGNRYITEMAKWATVPVIDLQCDLYHPMQAIADLMTMHEKLGSLRKAKVSIIWAYATTHKKPISVPVSQVLLFPRYGMDVTLAYPEGYDLPESIINRAREHAARHGGSLKVTHNMEAAYRDADVVYPKNWGSWVSNQSTAGADELLEGYRGWKCTEKVLQTANKDVLYMHALPADRGNEVEDSVIDGPHSVVYDEAENRLHTAKAVMALTMGGR